MKGAKNTNTPFAPGMFAGNILISIPSITHLWRVDHP
jgi:hypothetical protein